MYRERADAKHPMQSVLENLCRCFGTGASTADPLDSFRSHEDNNQHQHHHHDVQPGGTPPSASPGAGGNRVPSTPDTKRRTSRLSLQDAQWDALFMPKACGGGGGGNSSSNLISPQPSSATKKSPGGGGGGGTATSSSRRQGGNRPNSNSNNNNDPSRTSPTNSSGGSSSSSATPKPIDPVSSVEQAQAVARVKLAASRPSSRGGTREGMGKRKRSSSRDDIFRSKKQETPNRQPRGGTGGTNPISRFLSNHPAWATSLCFATPIKDSNDEPDELPLPNSNSVVSETNTLNTAGDNDTMTSTVYYETTKLAGLEQTNPPMPLFNHFQVDARDDIHLIVATNSHSTLRFKNTASSAAKAVQSVTGVPLDDDDDDEEGEEDNGRAGDTTTTTNNSKNSKNNKSNKNNKNKSSRDRRRAPNAIVPTITISSSPARRDEPPPPMTDCSSGSSRSSSVPSI